MKLNEHMASALLSLKNDAAKIKSKIVHCLRDLDVNFSFIGSKYSVTSLCQDSNIFYAALNAVTEIEQASDLLFNVIDKRNIEYTKTYKNIELFVRRSSARMYRNLWYMSLSPSCCLNLINMLGRIATLTVWEDYPSNDYSKIKSDDFSGVIAFMHCYGISFVEYDMGVATYNARTLLLSSLEEAVSISDKNFDNALKIISGNEEHRYLRKAYKGSKRSRSLCSQSAS